MIRLSKKVSFDQFLITRASEVTESKLTFLKEIRTADERKFLFMNLGTFPIKVTFSGEGGQKCSKICPHGLWTTPNRIHIELFHLVLI